MTRERILRVNNVADRLGLTARRVRQLLKEGKIAYFKESERKTLVPESAVEAFKKKDFFGDIEI